ncbi:hypothetical protein DPMN_115230 [Dreissena polymorpha]|uniref:Uncharacterized protein n=1 Tax=Dreissena polymorpha TaxID=45954 RepID=A0A9D4KM26_DREPO|nr:hypothetical protein DPMN_115230 [Dreissena polymorpha]
MKKGSAFWTISTLLMRRGNGTMTRRQKHNPKCGKQEQVLRRRKPGSQSLVETYVYLLNG